MKPVRPSCDLRWLKAHTPAIPSEVRALTNEQLCAAQLSNSRLPPTLARQVSSYATSFGMRMRLHQERMIRDEMAHAILNPLVQGT